MKAFQLWIVRVATLLITAAAAIAPSMSTAQSVDCLAAGTPVNSVDMRVLVLAGDGTEAVLPAVQSVLDHVGIPYDLVIARDQLLTSAMLCNAADGAGHGTYQGVLLTTGSLGFQNASGGYESALTWEEWNLLWSYEAKYRVRQASFYTYPGGWPDTYGLLSPSAAVDTTTSPIKATLTLSSPAGSGNPSGAQLFADLKSAAPITITNAYTYLSSAADANVTPLLVDAAGHPLASIRNYADGRKNLTLTMDGNPSLIHSAALGYGIVNWVTKGIYVGQRRVYLTAQPDDVLIADDIWDAAAKSDATGKTYRITGNDYNKFINWQTARNRRGPGTIALEIPFNASGATSTFPVEELYPAKVDDLTPAIRSNSSAFTWLSHTFTHLNLDSPTTYTQTLTELRQNNSTATQTLRLSNYFKDALITPDVSGLNNPEALRAMSDFGVRYVVSNTSLYCGNRNATTPPRPCPAPNMGVYNDLQPNILMVPRYPANLFYNVCQPADWVSEYNFLYRSYWGRDLSYQEILGKESDIWLRYLLNFDIRPVMFHQPNMCAYDGTHSLLGDLIDATVNKFAAISSLPPQSRQLRQIGVQMADRMKLAAALKPASGMALVARILPGATGSSIVLTNPTGTAVQVPLTGVSWPTATSLETYGGQTTSRVLVNGGGGSVTVTGAPAW